MNARSARLPRAVRLLRSWEFRRANRRGRRVDGGEFILLLAPTALAGPERRTRLGLTVSRKVGGAVVRNRVKRHVREWFRTHVELLPAGLDIVVIARRSAASLSSRQIGCILSRALREVPA